MSQSCRKFAQTSQPVALLLESSGLSNPVRHQTHESLRQLRHFLNKIGKQRGRKAQRAAIRLGPPAYGKRLHPRKREHAGDVARLQIKGDGVARQLTLPLKLSLENHEHRIRRVTLTRVVRARLEIQLLRLA